MFKYIVFTICFFLVSKAKSGELYPTFTIENDVYKLLDSNEKIKGFYSEKNLYKNDVLIRGHTFRVNENYILSYAKDNNLVYLEYYMFNEPGSFRIYYYIKDNLIKEFIENIPYRDVDLTTQTFEINSDTYSLRKNKLYKNDQLITNSNFINNEKIRLGFVFDEGILYLKQQEKNVPLDEIRYFYIKNNEVKEFDKDLVFNEVVWKDDDNKEVYSHRIWSLYKVYKDLNKYKKNSEQSCYYLYNEEKVLGELGFEWFVYHIEEDEKEFLFNNCDKEFTISDFKKIFEK